MSSQRPFYANFLAAFRAVQHHKPSATSATSPSSHLTPTSVSQASPASNPRSISTTTTSKHASTGPGSGSTTAALGALHSPRTTHPSSSPLSRSPGPNPQSHTPSTSPNESTNRYMSTSHGRRGSDSSSEGFRDVLGAETWYIGGRTAAGEERYFKLGVVRRQRSMDRVSLDRLSL